MIPKFRAWDKKYKMLMRVNQIDFLKGTAWLEADQGDHETRHTLTRCFDDVIFMQSTDLKDKNGVEIYEGGVDRSESGEISVIVYLIKAGSYCVMPLEIYLNEDFQNANFFPELLYNFGYDCTFDNQISEKYLKIVGNIYENPELLEVSE